MAVGECDTSETDLNLFMTTFFPSVTELLSTGLGVKRVLAASPWDFKDPRLLFLHPALERYLVISTSLHYFNISYIYIYKSEVV